MDLSNHPAGHGLVDRGDLVTALGNPDWHSNPGGRVGNPPGHDTRPRSSWSCQRFTRRIVGLVRSCGARGTPVHGGHGYRLRTGSRPPDRTSPGWVAPVTWAGTVFWYGSLGVGHRPGADDSCTGTLDDRSRDNHSESAGFGKPQHSPGNPRARCGFDRRVWTHPRYLFTPDPQVRCVVAAYAPGWVRRARSDLRAGGGEIENPGDPALLTRSMRSSSQLPECLSLLIVSSFGVVAEKIGFEIVVGSFSAGMVVGLATSGRGEDQELFRQKMEAICFAVFVPFFFVMSGMKLDVQALFHSARSFMLVPVFLSMFVVVRGSPVLLYRGELRKEERLPFALYSSTQLPMVVAITEIGLRLNILQTEIATALIGAGLLSVLLFPAIADATLPPPIQSETASATD